MRERERVLFSFSMIRGCNLYFSYISVSMTIYRFVTAMHVRVCVCVCVCARVHKQTVPFKSLFVTSRTLVNSIFSFTVFYF